MTAFVGFPQDGHEFSAEEVGLALAGLIVRDSGVPRVGMLGAGPDVAAVAASWKVEVGVFAYVHQGDGAIQISGLSEAEQVDIESAVGIPGGQSRIDRICWDPVDAELVVLQGTPAASPVAPAAGAYASVARVLVTSGDGMVISGKVTPDFSVTALVTAEEVVRRTVPVTLTGSPSWNGVLSWQGFSVVFPAPFAAAPHLEATGVFPAEAVQTMQIIQVTAAGFTGRVLRFGHAVPLGGQVTYTAAEK